MSRYLSLCLIVKDEDADALHEWVAYHTRIGVEGFFIYDNGSAVPVRQTLADELAAGGVIVHEIGGAYMQDTAYAHCLHFYGNTSRWIGFIDSDEFLYPKSNDDIRTLLKDYEDAGGLAVNWTLFGSSGHAEKPDGLQIENFTRRCPLPPGELGLVKSIVQPARVINVQTPHAFHYVAGYGAVGENHDPLEGAFRAATAEKIQLNHYVLRSRQQYEQKLRRGRGDHGQSAYHSPAYFNEIDASCTIEDRGIYDLYRRLLPDAPLSRPAFVPAGYVPPPDRFTPEQVDYLRYARAAQDARQVGDDATLALVYRIAAEKYPDMPGPVDAGEDAYGMIALGRTALAEGRLRAAGEAFEQVLRRNPWDYPAWEGILAVFEKIDGGTA